MSLSSYQDLSSDILLFRGYIRSVSRFPRVALFTFSCKLSIEIFLYEAVVSCEKSETETSFSRALFENGNRGPPELLGGIVCSYADASCN
jgi:hypothetical protein